VAVRTPSRAQFAIGESVKVISGPLSDFSGEISEINEDAGKLKVLVSIFGARDAGRSRLRPGQEDLGSERECQEGPHHHQAQAAGGQASPAPPVGPALGQHRREHHGVVKAFNAQTADNMGGTTIPS
jgi:hypothetical protein